MRSRSLGGCRSRDDSLGASATACVCRAPCLHVRRGGSRLGWITPRHLPWCELGLPRAFYPAILIDDRAELTPDLRSVYITAFSVRHFHHPTSIRSSAVRIVRCAALHRRAGDFSSIPINFLRELRRYKITQSVKPGRTPRRLRIRPLVALDATLSTAVQSGPAGSSQVRLDETD